MRSRRRWLRRLVAFARAGAAWGVLLAVIAAPVVAQQRQLPPVPPGGSPLPPRDVIDFDNALDARLNEQVRQVIAATQRPTAPPSPPSGVAPVTGELAPQPQPLLDVAGQRTSETAIKGLLLTRDIYVSQMNGFAANLDALGDLPRTEKIQSARAMLPAATELRKAYQRMRFAEEHPENDLMGMDYARRQQEYYGLLERNPVLSLKIDARPLWEALFQADFDTGPFGERRSLLPIERDQVFVETFNSYLQAGARQVREEARRAASLVKLEDLWVFGTDRFSRQWAVAEQLGRSIGSTLPGRYVDAARAVHTGAQITQDERDNFWNALSDLGLGIIGAGAILIPVWGPLISAGVTLVYVVRAGADVVVAYTDVAEAERSAPVTGYRHVLTAEDRAAAAKDQLMFMVVAGTLDVAAAAGNVRYMRGQPPTGGGPRLATEAAAGSRRPTESAPRGAPRPGEPPAPLLPGTTATPSAPPSAAPPPGRTGANLQPSAPEPGAPPAPQSGGPGTVSRRPLPNEPTAPPPLRTLGSGSQPPSTGATSGSGGAAPEVLDLSKPAETPRVPPEQTAGRGATAGPQPNPPAARTPGERADASRPATQRISPEEAGGRPAPATTGPSPRPAAPDILDLSKPDVGRPPTAPPATVAAPTPGNTAGPPAPSGERATAGTPSAAGQSSAAADRATTRIEPPPSGERPTPETPSAPGQSSAAADRAATRIEPPPTGAVDAAPGRSPVTQSGLARTQPPRAGAAGESARRPTDSDPERTHDLLTEGTDFGRTQDLPPGPGEPTAPPAGTRVGNAPASAGRTAAAFEETIARGVQKLRELNLPNVPESDIEIIARTARTNSPAGYEAKVVLQDLADLDDVLARARGLGIPAEDIQRALALARRTGTPAAYGNQLRDDLTVLLANQRNWEIYYGLKDEPALREFQARFRFRNYTITDDAPLLVGIDTKMRLAARGEAIEWTAEEMLRINGIRDLVRSGRGQELLKRYEFLPRFQPRERVVELQRIFRDDFLENLRNVFGEAHR